jgi:hypothetical protein
MIEGKTMVRKFFIVLILSLNLSHSKADHLITPVIYIGPNPVDKQADTAKRIVNFLKQKYNVTISVSRDSFDVRKPLPSYVWLLGNANNNPAIEFLCNSNETLVDKSWPGEKGFIIQNIKRSRIAAVPWYPKMGSRITVIGVSEDNGYEELIDQIHQLTIVEENKIKLKEYRYIPILSNIDAKLLQRLPLNKNKLMENPKQGYMVLGLNYIPDLLNGQHINTNDYDFGAFFDAAEMCNGRRQEAISTLAWAYSQNHPLNPYYGNKALIGRIIAAMLFVDDYILTPENHISEYGYDLWTVASDGFGLSEYSIAFGLIKPHLDVYTANRLQRILTRIAITTADDDGLYADNQTIAATLGILLYKQATGLETLGEKGRGNMSDRVPAPLLEDIINHRTQMINERVKLSSSFSETWRGGFDIGYNSVSRWYHYLYLLNNPNDIESIKSAWLNLEFNTYIHCPQKFQDKTIYINGYYPNTRNKWGGGARQGIFENPCQCLLISKFFSIPKGITGDEQYSPFYKNIDFKAQILNFYQDPNSWDPNHQRTGLSSCNNVYIGLLYERLTADKFKKIEQMPSKPFTDFPQFSNKNIWKEFPNSYLLCVKKPAYYSYLFWDQYPVNSRGGGGLGVFWTKEAGAKIVSCSWNDLLIHHVRAKFADKEYCSYNIKTNAIRNELDNTVEISGSLGPINMIRKYKFEDNNLNVSLTLSNSKNGHCQEIIPLFALGTYPVICDSNDQPLGRSSLLKGIKELNIDKNEKGISISFNRPVDIILEDIATDQKAADSNNCFFTALRIQLNENDLQYKIIP